MISTLLFKKPICVNRSLHDYCRKSTEESIRKQTEKYNLERNKPTLNPVFNKYDINNTPEFNIYTFLLFLSMSTISFYFYKRLH
jgi:hypothetical protein